MEMSFHDIALLVSANTGKSTCNYRWQNISLRRLTEISWSIKTNHVLHLSSCLLCSRQSRTDVQFTKSSFRPLKLRAFQFRSSHILSKSMQMQVCKHNVYHFNNTRTCPHNTMHLKYMHAKNLSNISRFVERENKPLYIEVML